MAARLLTFAMLFCGWAGFASAEPLDPLSVIHVRCTLADGGATEGTGVIVSAQGLVITARHVARESAICQGRRGSREAGSLRDLTPVGDVSRYDYALMKLTPAPYETFDPVPVAAQTDTLTGSEIEIWGFPENGPATPSVRKGTISNSIADERGFIESLTIHSPGMSGGPVLAFGRLVALVAGVDWNRRGGLVANYALLSADVFRADIRDMREDVAADLREDRIAAIETAIRREGVCNELLRDALNLRYPDLIPALTADGAAEPPGSSLSKIADYWVTITTGPARWLDCKEGNLRTSHYFPMGLILRPIRDIAITDPNGSLTDWTMFQTEYGLLVLIDRIAIEPVTAEVGYVFSDGTLVAKLCGPEDAPDCNPGENLPPLNNNTTRWPYLSSWDSYLRTTNVDALEASWAEFLEFRKNQDLIYAKDPRTLRRSFTPRLPETLDGDPACKVQEAFLYEFQKHYNANIPDGNAEYARQVKFSLCSTPPATAPVKTVGYRPIKVVTHAIAARLFSDLWFAEVRVNPTDLVKTLSAVLPDTPSASIDVIECGQLPGAREGLGDVTRNDNPVAIDAVMALETMVPASIDGENIAQRIRLYQPSPGNSKSRTLSHVPLFQNINLVISCGDDKQPMRALAVRISFEPVFDEPLELDMKAIENAYISRFGSYGFEGRRHIKNGYIDRICDYPEYRGWLYIIKSEIKKDVVAQQAASRLNVDVDIVANHFAHLLLATLFFTSVELQTQENPIGGCSQ